MNSFRFRCSVWGIAVALIYFVIAVVRNIDGFESTLPFLQRWDSYELDELIVSFSIVLIFFLCDCILMLRRCGLEKERIRIYRATLDSTHHILNNFLNQAQILELVASDCPHIDPEVIDMYRSTVEEATAKLSKLDKLENIDPEAIRQAVAPEGLGVPKLESLPEVSSIVAEREGSTTKFCSRVG